MGRKPFDHLQRPQRLKTAFPFKRSLRSYQEIASNCAENKQLVAFFCPFGSGKTTLAGKWLHSRIQTPSNILILCGKNDVLTWEVELEEMGFPLQSFSFESYDSLGFQKRITLDTNLNSAIRSIKHREKVNQLSKNDYQAVIIDEVSRCKNRNAQRTVATTRLLDRIRKANPSINIAILTALPTPQAKTRFEDIWAQIRILDGGQSLGTNFWQFIKRYAFPAKTPFNTEIIWTPTGRKRVLEKIQHLTVTIPDELVYSEVEPVETQTISLTPTNRQLKIYARMLENFESTTGYYLNSQIETTHALRKFSVGIEDSGWKPNQKTLWIKDQLKDKNRSWKRAIVFSSYTEEIEALSHYFQCPKFTGNLTVKQRKAIRQQFAENNQPLLICNESLAIGLNEFSAADSVIYTSPNFATQDYEQSSHRIIRPSKLRQVDKLHIFHLILFPIDKEIFKAIRNHLSIIDWLKREGWKNARI